MRIVMTGATSFVGAASVKELLSQGHEVIAVVRPSSKRLNRLMPEGRRIPAGSEPILAVSRASAESGRLAAGSGQAAAKTGPLRSGGSLTIVENEIGEAGLLTEKITGVCDVFCHFAWGGSGSEARDDEKLQENNFQAALAAMRVAKELGCKRFLFSGSQAEYGLHYDAMTEETSCEPRSAYGSSKLAVLHEGGRLCAQMGMEYVHLRIFSVYGPNDHPWTLVESCLEHFLNGTELLLGACTQKWNFLYIDDLARAVCRLVQMPLGVVGETEGPVFNLAGEETKPLREFVEDIYKACGGNGPYCFGKRADNAEGAVNLIPDIRKIKRVTGWRPETDFEAGIRECIRRREMTKKAITTT